MTLICEKLYKISNNPKKYIIHNKETTDSLRHFRDGIMKFEQLYNKIVFARDDYNNVSSIPIDENPKSHHTTRSAMDTTFNITNENLGMESFTLNSKLSQFMEDINIGHLLPLSCGHCGIFKPEELEIYQLLLYQANFISNGNN